MNNLILILFIGSISLFSCKREKVDVIGPEVGIASSDFNIDSFKFNSDYSDFQNPPASNWFKAGFSQRVSWEIKISGTQSKAYKVISGISDGLNQANSSWYGTHTNVYFFIEGEKVIAELSVLGTNEKWVDSSTIIAEIKDYGPDALLWWDMTSFPSGQGVTIPYWYSYFSNNNDSVVSWRKLKPSEIIDPVQGPYISMEATNKNASSAWWAGFGMPNITPVGFSGASPEDVYLNFYIRQRTPTTPSMGGSINSISGRVVKQLNLNAAKSLAAGHDVYDTIWKSAFTSLSFTVLFPNGSSTGGSELLPVPKGYVKASEGGGGWNLVSMKLSDMKPGDVKPPSYDNTFPFNPGKIVSFTGSMGVAESTGFDMDFIVFTRGVPFNQIK